MRAPKAFLFDFQLTRDIEVRKKEGSKEYILLAARSFEPQKNGMYFNALFQCFDDVKERVERMKLRKGSVVDIIAEMAQYKKGDTYDTAYRVIDISFSESAQKESQKKETETPKTFMENMNSIFLPNK